MDQQAINAKVVQATPEHAWDSTVAIVIAVDGGVHTYGTGVLLKIADHAFVVSAGHIFKNAAKAGKTLGVAAGNSGSMIAFDDDCITSAAGQYGSIDDPFDIALCRISEEKQRRFNPRLKYLRMDDIDFDEQSPTAVCSLFGFPTAMSRPSTDSTVSLQVQPFEFSTHRYSGPTDECQNFQDRLHLLLDADPSFVTESDGSPAQFTDRQGNLVPFPSQNSLGGMSGCSVWRIGDLAKPIDDWPLDRPRIVAVQTGVYSRLRVIKATRWIAVSTLIYSAFPELRPSLELWRTA